MIIIFNFFRYVEKDRFKIYKHFATNIVLYYYLKHTINEFMNIMSLLVYCLDSS